MESWRRWRSWLYIIRVRTPDCRMMNAAPPWCNINHGPASPQLIYPRPAPRRAGKLPACVPTVSRYWAAAGGGMIVRCGINVLSSSLHSSVCVDMDVMSNIFFNENKVSIFSVLHIQLGLCLFESLLIDIKMCAIIFTRARRTPHKSCRAPHNSAFESLRSVFSSWWRWRTKHQFIVASSSAAPGPEPARGSWRLDGNKVIPRQTWQRCLTTMNTLTSVLYRSALFFRQFYSAIALLVGTGVPFLRIKLIILNTE